jgi:maltose-binding protein MalE
VTLTALAFAAIAAVAARRTLRVELERDRLAQGARERQEELARRAQAAMVSAWWVDSAEHRGFLLRNASQAPVYRAYATVIDINQADAPPFRLDLPVVAPSLTAVPYAVDQSVVPARPMNAASDLRVTVTFTDAAGLRWLRDPHGHLGELTPTVRMWSALVEATMNVLQQFNEQFQATYGMQTVNGVAIDFEITERGHALENRFIVDSQPSDILLAAHDWLGNFVSHDAVDAIVLPQRLREAFPPWTLDAVSVGGRLYGVPIVVDTMALIRNVDLVATAPRSFADIFHQSAPLLARGAISTALTASVGPEGDPFQIWPVISGAGGWLFRQDQEGHWTPEVIGIDAPETIAALTHLRSLGDAGTRSLRADVGRAEAIDLFVAGKAPFLLGSASAAVQAKAQGVQIEVTPVPSVAPDVPARSFVSVNACFISKRAANKTVAHDLVPDFLARPSALKGLQGVMSVIPARTGDDVIDVYADLCRHGMPMPSFPAMVEVWALLGQAEVALLNGANAAQTAARVGRELRALFA